MSFVRRIREKGIAGSARAVFRRLGEEKSTSRGLPPVWSEYLSWLTYANAGMMDRGNVACFDYAIRNLPSTAPIVEIGSFCGLSTNAITHLKSVHNVKNNLVTCDKWIFERSNEGKTLDSSSAMTHVQYREFVKETYRRNVTTFSSEDLPRTVEAFSDEFFTLWALGKSTEDIFGREITLGGPISFCYIDGNHTYEFAKRDFVNADRFLEKGGFILFDDSADGSGWGVCTVIDEVKSSGRYEVVANNPNYLFRKLR